MKYVEVIRHAHKYYQRNQAGTLERANRGARVRPQTLCKYQIKFNPKENIFEVVDGWFTIS